LSFFFFPRILGLFCMTAGGASTAASRHARAHSSR
jgi:hypothetical protein